MPLAAGSAYVGAWIDYSKGTIYGPTITIPAHQSPTVVAAAAVLVSLASISFWELFCFIVHHIRSTAKARDGLFHQQQLLLRNGNPPLLTSLRMLILGIQWRSNTRWSIFRAAPLCIMGFSTFAFFAVSGLFTGKIITRSNEILARGHCGFVKGSLGGHWLGGNTTERTIGDVLYQAGSTSFREESSYARTCYNKQVDTAISSCNVFTKPYIPSTRSDDEPCPFANHTCLVKPVSFDTGIFSSKDLGINSKPEDEVQLRRKLTCVPIDLERYTTGWTQEQRGNVGNQFSFLVPGDSYKYYDLGPSIVDEAPVQDYFFAFSNSTLQTQSLSYTLMSSNYIPGPTTLKDSSFLPIADLNVTDADLTILFLSKRVVYTGPVNDPWFKATVQADTPYGLKEVYYPDQPVTAVACTEQYQFCNGDRCSPLSGSSLMFSGEIPDVGFNQLQVAMYTLLLKYTSFMQLNLMLQFIRNEILLANELLYGSNPISSVPDTDHWTKEIENLNSISLAGMQAHGVLHAAPGNAVFKKDINLHDFIDLETSSENVHLCKNQKFRSAEYTSFSVFGLAMIAAICFTIIILQLVVPPIVSWSLKQLSRARGVPSVSRTAWIEDDVLQLQRIALEAKGLGPWNGTAQAVPVLDSQGEQWQRNQYAGGGFVQQEEGYVEQAQTGYVDVKQPLNWQHNVVRV